jgi:transposase
MRYELTDHEWAAIRPMLPNKPRGVARVNDRRSIICTAASWAHDLAPDDAVQDTHLDRPRASARCLHRPDARAFDKHEASQRRLSILVDNDS